MMKGFSSIKDPIAVDGGQCERRLDVELGYTHGISIASSVTFAATTNPNLTCRFAQQCVENLQVLLAAA